MTVILISSETNASQMYTAYGTDKKSKLLKKEKLSILGISQEQQRINSKRNSFSTTINMGDFSANQESFPNKKPYEQDYL